MIDISQHHITFIRFTEFISEVHWMEFIIGYCISEHFSFIFGQHTVIDVGSWPQIMINTCRNCLSYQLDRLLSCHIVFVFCLEDCHCLQWTWTHRCEREIWIAMLIYHRTFLHHSTYINGDQGNRILLQLDVPLNALCIDKEVWMSKSQMN